MITLEKRSLVIGFVGGLLVMLVAWMTSANVFNDDAASVDASGSATTIVATAPETELQSGASDAELAPEPAAEEAAAAPRFSDLPTIRPADLPFEALETLTLIGDGGPYPFNQDDGVFQNREGFLPDEERGHYREYTVVTPGENDRGARRIVAGQDGELYYTSDHYASFSEIVLEGGG